MKDEEFGPFSQLLQVIYTLVLFFLLIIVSALNTIFKLLSLHLIYVFLDSPRVILSTLYPS